MTKKNILVFPCGSEIALDIYSSVQYSAYFHLIGANSVDDHGRFVYEDYIGNVPFANSCDFIPYIKEIVKNRNIHAIYPTMDSVIAILKQAEKELNCKIIAPSENITEICLSKEKTYNKLKDIVPIPKIFDIDKVEEFPVFIKPKIGYGAIGTKLILSPNELLPFIEEKDKYIVCEYLPGEEYTVDCFTDRKGNLLFSRARIRKRVKSGVSVNTYFVQEQEVFQELAEKINNVIAFRGAWFFQVKHDKDDNLCLLEVACRLGGSSMLSKGIGVNFALMTLFDHFDYDVNILTNDYNIELDRAFDCKYKTDIYFDAVYVDYDDCLLLDKTTINTKLITFLYKCVNEKKEIILLSKHDGDLINELKNFRLFNIFDKIIHIQPNQNKVDFIKHKNAIFIDDSFAERFAVKNEKHINVFSPDMIDVLL